MIRIERAEAGSGEKTWTNEKRPSPSLSNENANGSRRFEQIEPGIYRNSRNGKYFERPIINGKRTWRSLGGKNLKFAKEEFYRRRAAVSAGKNPYAEAQSEHAAITAKTVGDVIRRYQQDNYLDSNLLPRPDGTREDEERHCTTLLQFWASVAVAEVSDRVCDEYRDWRIRRVKQGEGLRAIDRGVEKHTRLIVLQKG